MGKEAKQLRRRLAEAKALRGVERRALLDEVIVAATEAGEDVVEYEARLQLIDWASMNSDLDCGLANFGWCLGRHDSDPDRFPQKAGGQDLLWMYKWMAPALCTNPRFSLTQVDAVVADLRARYERAGVGMSGALEAEFAVARRIGRREHAAELFHQREVTPRDPMSDCEFCTLDSTVRYLIANDQDAAALELFDAAMEKETRCRAQPRSLQGAVLRTLLQAGRSADAVHYHRVALRAVKAAESPFSGLSEHLEFCAVTGNEARGLALLETYLPNLVDNALALSTRIYALRSYGVLLDAVTRAGHGDTLVRGAESPGHQAILGPHDGPWTARDLAAASWAAAEALAAQFDARNGNHEISGHVAWGKALGDERYDAPLGGDVIVADVVVTQPDPVDAEGWFKASHLRLNLFKDPEGAVAAALRGLEKAGDYWTGRLLWLAAAAHLAAGHVDEVEPLVARRSELLRAQGRTEQAEAEARSGWAMLGRREEGDAASIVQELGRARLGTDPLLLCELLMGVAYDALQQGNLEEAATLAHEVLVSSDDELVVRWRASAHWLLALVALQEEQLAVAAEHLAAMLGESDVPDSMRARALHVRAQVLRDLGETEKGLRCIDEVLEMALIFGYRPMVVEVARVGAGLLGQLGRFHEAVARYQLAIRQARLADQDTFGLRYELGRNQSAAGADAAALQTFEDLVREADPERVGPGALGETQYMVGLAARKLDDLNVAFQAFGRASEQARLIPDAELEARAEFAAGELLFRVEHDGAVERLSGALEAARRAEVEPLVRQIRHLLGSAKVASGDPEGLADLDVVEAEYRAAGLDGEAADVVDSRARAAQSLGRPDEAVALFLQAADGFAKVGAEVAAGYAEWRAAHVLLGEKRPSEAVALLRAALCRFAPGAPVVTQINLDLAETLQNLGRDAEAAEVRAQLD